MSKKTKLPMIYIKALSYVFALPLIMTILLFNLSFLSESIFANFIIITFIIVYIPISTLFTIYLYLAPNGVCFLFATENVATLIQSGGKFVDVAYSSRNLEVDKNTFEVIEKKKKDSWLKKIMKGLTFFGITPYKEVLYITLKHNKLFTQEKDGVVKYRVEKTEKETCRIDLRKTNYGMNFSGMETKERNQISVVVSTTLRVTNIYNFLDTKDVYIILEEFLVSAFRIFVKGKGTDELIGSSENDKKALLGKEFFEYLTDSSRISNIQVFKVIDKNNNIRAKIEDLGFELRNFSVLDVILNDQSADEASKMLYTAEKKKEALLIEADGEAKKIERIAAADATRIKLIAETCEQSGISTETIMLIDKIKGSQAEYVMYSGNLETGQRNLLNEQLGKKQTVKKD